MSKALLTQIADHSGICEEDVKIVLSSLKEVALDELQKHNKFNFKDFMVLHMKKKPARAARVVHLFGHRVVARAHPARNVIKATISPKFLKRAQPAVDAVPLPDGGVVDDGVVVDDAMNDGVVVGDGVVDDGVVDDDPSDDGVGMFL